MPWLHCFSNMSSSLGNNTRPARNQVAPSRRQYRNPPIIEATCEFRFAPGDPWNQTVGWSFYERIKSRYQGQPVDQRLIQIGDPEPGTKPQQQRAIEINQVQIPSSDGLQLVTVGPNLASIYVRKPYPGWEKFREEMDFVVSAYSSVAKQQGIRRIGIRYVNQILAAEGTNPRAVFVECPSVSIFAGAALRQFIHRNEYIFEDEPIKGVAVFALGANRDDPNTFLLDIDVSQEWQPASLPVRSAMKRVDELRNREKRNV
jgi:uncharacterized protein (TIGR04255 family)